MNTIILSSLSLAILLLIVVVLFFKLKYIRLYNVVIFIFLTLFWSVMAMMKKVSVPNQPNLEPWAWSLCFASYQFTQVIVRLPLGWLSKRLVSRKIPILISTFSITFSLFMIVITNFALPSIIFGLIVTGIFGATFGMQNQYWSENYNLRNVYWTIAIVSIMPSFGALLGDIAGKTITSDSTTAWWFLLALGIFMLLVSIGYALFPEHKKTIKLDNIASKKHLPIMKMRLSHVLKLSFQAVLISFAFNILTTRASYQDAISSYADNTSIILTVAAIATALLTVIYLAHILTVHKLIVIGHLAFGLGILIGIINYFTSVQNSALHLCFLICITIGFTLLQNIMVGVTLHFDHKNTLLVLGIWLTMRSAGAGAGQFVGEYIISEWNDYYQYLLIVAIILVTTSCCYFLFLAWHNQKINKLLQVIDSYEYHQGFSAFIKNKRQ